MGVNNLKTALMVISSSGVSLTGIVDQSRQALLVSNGFNSDKNVQNSSIEVGGGRTSPIKPSHLIKAVANKKQSSTSFEQ